MDTKKTGEFLAAMRKSKGYTQQAVAEWLNLSNKTVSKWESGAGLPDIAVLPALAELYGVTADEILAGKRLEGEPSGAEAVRCRETGLYLLRRCWLVMDICGLFALAVSIWQTCVFWKDLSWQVLLYQWGYSFPAALYYLLMAAIVVVCAGALIQRYYLAAARPVAAEEDWLRARRQAVQKAAFLLTMLLCLLARWVLWRTTAEQAAFALLLAAAWLVLLKKRPDTAAAAARVLLLLAGISILWAAVLPHVLPESVLAAQVSRPGKNITVPVGSVLDTLFAEALPPLLLLSAAAAQACRERRRT